MSDVLDRFLRYVRYDTQSDEKSTAFPSTDKQLILLRALTDEFRARLAALRQDRNNVGNQEKTREILDWYRDQRRAILRGDGRSNQ